MIDTFSCAEFEAALEQIAPKGWVHVGPEDGEHVTWRCRRMPNPTWWVHVGPEDGEHVYRIPVGELVVTIRSSVRPDGTSAGAGEDSIRVYVLDRDDDPWGPRWRGT